MAERKLNFKASIRKVFYDEPQTFSDEASDNSLRHTEQKITKQNNFDYSQNDSSVDLVSPVTEQLELLNFDEVNSVSSESTLNYSSSSPSLYSPRFSGCTPPAWNQVFKEILGHEQPISEVEIKAPFRENSFEDISLLHGVARGRISGPNPKNVEDKSFHESLPRTRGPRFNQRNSVQGSFSRRQSSTLTGRFQFDQRKSMKEDNCSEKQSSDRGFQFTQRNSIKGNDCSWKQSSARAREPQQRQWCSSKTNLWKGKRDPSSKYLTDKEYEEIKKIERTLRAAQTFRLPESSLTLNDFDGSGVNCFTKEFQMPPVVPKKPPKHSFTYEVHGRKYYFQSDSDEELEHDIKYKPKMDVTCQNKKKDSFLKQKISVEPTEYWDDDPVVITKS